MEDEFPVRPAMKEDLIQIREIFNGYVRESFAAYPVQEVDLGYFEALHREGAFIPPYVVEYEGTVIGFGMIRPFLPFPTFRSSGQVSYFIHPPYTRRGLGGRLLEQLTRLAQAQGIHILLASISSRNEASLRFHAKHGFIECGRLRGIGEKFGKRFDVVWMQKEV